MTAPARACPISPDRPADHADHGDAFTQSEQKPPADQHCIGSAGRKPTPTGRSADQPGQRVEDQAALHAQLAAEAIGPRTGARSGQDRRQEGDADGEPAPGIAEAQSVHDMDRYRRQRHRHGEIG
jgi:hypothetical protein